MRNTEPSQTKTGLFVASIAIATLFSNLSHAAEVKGIAKDKPAKGPFVKVDDGYMVTYTETIPGTDATFEMVPIPGGKYKMGSPPEEADRKEDEGPQIEVIVDPMWVAKTEVNWEQYTQYMELHELFRRFTEAGMRAVSDDNKVDAVTAPTPLYDPGFTFEFGDDPKSPASTMTKYSAQQFTKWLSGITGAQYRLPTEAEWEYAARGGTTSAYSWGEDADSIDDYAWYFDNADEGVEAVGLKEANPFGLHDMHGSMAEWTINDYTEDGYASLVDQQPLNATAMLSLSSDSVPGVLRGGGWEFDPEDLRSASRLPTDVEAWQEGDPNIPLSPWWFASDPTRSVGFRVFRSYKALPKETITKFWDPSSEEVIDDVEMKVNDGRSYFGIVDPELPKAIEEVSK